MGMEQVHTSFIQTMQKSKVLQTNAETGGWRCAVTSTAAATAQETYPLRVSGADTVTTLRAMHCQCIHTPLLTGTRNIPFRRQPHLPSPCAYALLMPPQGLCISTSHQAARSASVSAPLLLLLLLLPLPAREHGWSGWLGATAALCM